MKRVRERAVWVAPCLLALLGACGEAESSTRVGPDAGASALGGDEPSDDVLADVMADAGGGPLGTEPCGEDGVVRDYVVQLETQADIDALAGCREVDGDLMLRAFPDMDTTPLRALRRVTGTLSVWGNLDNDPRALDGFSGVESVGDLSLHDLELTDLSAFAGLRTVRPGPSGPTGATPIDSIGDVLISGCSGLVSLSGLVALEHVDRLQLEQLPQLASLTGLDGLAELGWLSVSECPIESLTDLGKLELGGLYLAASQVRDLSGLSLTGNGTSVPSLVLSDNSVLGSLGGWQPPSELYSLELTNNRALSDLRGLEAVTALQYLVIFGESTLTGLTGMDGLARVGSLHAERNPRLQSLTGLGGVHDVGTLSLVGNEAFRDMAGLAPDAEIDSLTLLELPSLSALWGIESATLGSVYIESVPLLDLRGLEQATLRNGMTLQSLPALVSLAGLPNIPDPSSFRLVLMQCPAFRDLEALTSQAELDVLCLCATDLVDVDALSNLRRVNDLTICDNPRLAQMDGLGALQQLRGLQIGSNPALRAMPSFDGIQPECGDCAPSVRLVGNAALETVGPWPWLSSASLQVVDNPALVSISVPNLRSSGWLEVAGNTSLTTLDLSSLEEAGSLTVMSNPVFDDAALISIAQGPAFDQVKITGNLGGAQRLAPCPWVDDSVCDEASEVCAPGTDAADCSIDP